MDQVSTVSSPPSAEIRRKWLLSLGVYCSTTKLTAADMDLKVRAYAEGLQHVPDSEFTKTTVIECGQLWEFYPGLHNLTDYFADRAKKRAELIQWDRDMEVAKLPPPKRITQGEKAYRAEVLRRRALGEKFTDDKLKALRREMAA